MCWQDAIGQIWVFAIRGELLPLAKEKAHRDGNRWQKDELRSAVERGLEEIGRGERAVVQDCNCGVAVVFLDSPLTATLAMANRVTARCVLLAEAPPQV